MKRKVNCCIAGLASIAFISAATLLADPAGAVADGASSGTSGSASSCSSSPASINAINGGGEAYTYASSTGDGGSVTFPVPPTGFSPVDASDADLALYGFPPRPTDPDALATWTKVMATYKTTVTPDLCWDSTSPTPSTVPALNATSSNWSGHLDLPSSGNSFVGASGQFRQPERLTESCSNTYESTWVGIGGDSARSDGSWGLLQDGTEYEPSGAPYAWFEWWGKDPDGTLTGKKYPFAITVTPGDLMWFETYYDQSSGETYFYAIDETTGEAQTGYAPNSQAWYDGRTSEWIAERPSYKSGNNEIPYDLQNFGEIDWTVGEYTLQNNATLKIAQAATRRNLTMMNGADELATATTLQGSGGQFESNFHHCS